MIDPFSYAIECYGECGVDVESALAKMSNLQVSLHCWQGDDVVGFEQFNGQVSGGGIQATGSYPGRARNGDELRADMERVFGLLPGSHRINLHAIYAETGGRAVSRAELDAEHFSAWRDWAVSHGLGIDFNPSFFAHPLANSGFTLSHADASVRDFWIAHGRACRRIGEHFGTATDSPCITNVWVPDGMKDSPVDRHGPRQRLADSLDAIFSEPVDSTANQDAVESKLFGIGSESYVVGSHEFYLGYSLTRKTMLCLDSGHFHPTENIADKISSVLLFGDRILLHVSRGVRWDSDHVVILSDDTQNLADEVVRSGGPSRVQVGLDFFDASINRIAAWVIGSRNVLKAFLRAQLMPLETLRRAEYDMDYTTRLVLQEEAKTLPFGLVWNEWCDRHDVAQDGEWLAAVRDYERECQETRT